MEQKTKDWGRVSADTEEEGSDKEGRDNRTRERETPRKKKRAREREQKRERAGERVCVCVQREAHQDDEDRDLQSDEADVVGEQPIIAAASLPLINVLLCDPWKQEQLG